MILQEETKIIKRNNKTRDHDNLVKKNNNETNKQLKNFENKALFFFYTLI